MKPMNDAIRKQEFFKAGFFTLIPMLLVGCLVWGGMRGEGHVKIEGDYTKIISNARDSINHVYDLLEKIKYHKDTIEGMMEKRGILQQYYLTAIEKDTISNGLNKVEFVNTKTELEDYEASLMDFLRAELSNIKKLDIYKTAASQIVNFQNDLNLRIKDRKDYITSQGSEDEQIKKLKKITNKR